MTKKQINLIPKTSEADIKAQARKRRFRLFSIVVLSFVILLIASFYLLEAYFNLSISSLKDQNVRNGAKLTGLNENESVLRGIETKLARYKSIESSFPLYPKHFKMISDLASGVVSINSVAVENEGTMEVSVESVDKINLERFLSAFNTLAARSNFNQTQIKELSVLPQKSYKAILSFRW